ncbi:tetratricopeptide repeat protein [Micromonospora orduensis]|uniref:tetratricopeptide repeat protein n=1 Tax=Micromonospora orduensis TaxID=1420891 RepID=UPI0038209557
MDAYEIGKSAFQRGDFQVAWKSLEKAEDDGRALLLRAQMASNGDGRDEDPFLAARLYREAAERGSARAAYNLGVLHATGRGVEVDEGAAFSWYQRSAELGDADGFRMVGLMHATGQGGGPPDFDEAEKAWRTAAELGQREVFSDLGKLFAYHRQDPVQAADWYLKAAGVGDESAIGELLRLCPVLKAQADSGNTRARTLLGVIFMLYVDAPEETVAFLSQSSSEGDAVAQRTLAYLLERGQGVAVDKERAVRLYRVAAEGGDGIAAFNLGLHYTSGEVLEVDIPSAVHWLRVAAVAKIADAYPLLGNHLASLDLDEEALKWYLVGAEEGQASCMFVAASWYRDGIGTSVDLVQSLRWFIAMLDVGSGDGVHEAHQLVPRMTPEEVREAARLANRPLDADIFLAQRAQPSDGSEAGKAAPGSAES